MDEIAAMDLFNRMYLGGGWARVLPDSALGPLLEIAREGSATLEDIDLALRRSAESPEGLASSMWGPLHVYTDTELAELREKFEGTPFADDDHLDAEAVMAEEEELRLGRIAEMQRYAAHLGLKRVETIGDLMALMVEVGLVVASESGFSINPSAPLPSEVLPLSPDEIRREDEIRWEKAHSSNAMRIIELFHPANLARADRLTVTLGVLAAELGIDVESARAAVLLLVGDGDFNVSADLERVQPDDQFVMTVDWEVFDRQRMHISFGDPEASERDGRRTGDGSPS